MKKELLKNLTKKAKLYKKLIVIICSIIIVMISALKPLKELFNKTDLESTNKNALSNVNINQPRGITTINNYYSDQTNKLNTDSSISVLNTDIYLDSDTQYNDIIWSDSLYKSTDLYQPPAYFGLVKVLNYNNNEISLSKFTLHVNNIQINYEPVLEFFGSKNENEQYLVLTVRNKGWGDAINLNLQLYDDDNVLTNFFTQEDLTSSIDFVNPGEEIAINLLDFTDSEDEIISLTNGSDESVFITLNLQTKFESESSQYYKVLNRVGVLHITKDYISSLGGGAVQAKPFGIYIDTNKQNFDFTENVSNIIPSNEIIEIPLLFFPNKSCSFDFWVEFELFGNPETIIKTNPQHIELEVSSILQEPYFNDSKTLNKEVINDNKDTYITYPYSKNIIYNAIE